MKFRNNVFVDNPTEEESKESSARTVNLYDEFIALKEEMEAMDARVRSLEADNQTLKQAASKRFRAALSKKGLKATKSKVGITEEKSRGEGESDIESPVIRSSFGGIFFDFDEDDNEEHLENGALIRGLSHDTFSLLKVKPILSLSWLFSLSIYSLQTLLLTMILLQQIQEGENSTPFNIPFKVDPMVRAGQSFAIVVTVALSRDIFMPIRELSSLWINDEKEWLKVTGPLQEKNRYSMWITRILFPNLLQLLVGALNLVVSFIIIIQSDDVITLFADFAAMSVIAELDNIAFWFAEHGYVGDIIMQDSGKVQKVKIEDKILSIKLGRFCVFNLRMLLLLIMLLVMVAGFVPVVISQISGEYFKMKLPDCNIPPWKIPSINDGVCNGGIQNTFMCDFDGSDCISFNIEYPTCVASEPSEVGDGNCQKEYNNLECKYDGGDCCEKQNDGNLGDGVCHAGFYHTAQCLYDSGDCDDLRKKFPLCPDFPQEVTDEDGKPIVIGNGECREKNKQDLKAYMNEECGWVFGDCQDVREFDLEKRAKYPNCNVTDYFRIGNGECDEDEYLTEECGWDEFDCCGEDHSKIGDGTCDSHDYSTTMGEDNGFCNNYPESENGKITPYLTKECGYEGYDCCAFPEIKGNGKCEPSHTFIIQLKNCYYYCDKSYMCPKENVTFNAECGWDGGDCDVPGYPDCQVETASYIADGVCNAGQYNTEECGWDGGDCIGFNTKYPNCDASANLIPFMGNGKCEKPELNTLDCGWEDGDCITFNAMYPGCKANQPLRVGDGYCNHKTYGHQDYNNTECGWDGGDCIDDHPLSEFKRNYPNCPVSDPTKIGNGNCRRDYNNAECGWDGGDCFDFNVYMHANYPNCSSSQIPTFFGDGRCDGGDYNTEECGWDDGDCDDFNSKYPNCFGPSPYTIGDGYCNTNANTEECGWDGGDCMIDGYPDCHIDIIGYIGDGECDGDEYNTTACGFDGGDCLN